MIDERRDQDAEHDRHRSAKTRRQHEREQLRLVTDLRERHDAG
jgi:hypothetical protein